MKHIKDVSLIILYYFIILILCSNNSLSGGNIDFVLGIFHAYHVIIFHCDVQTEQMENEDTEGSQSDDASESGGDYSYLLGMPLYTLTEEKKEELLRKRDNKLDELKILQTRSHASLWKDDLDMFLQEVSFDKIIHFFKKTFLSIFIS
jgi:hypothetical protein